MTEIKIQDWKLLPQLCLQLNVNVYDWIFIPYLSLLLVYECQCKRMNADSSWKQWLELINSEKKVLEINNRLIFLQVLQQGTASQHGCSLNSNS